MDWQKIWANSKHKLLGWGIYFVVLTLSLLFIYWIAGWALWMAPVFSVVWTACFIVADYFGDRWLERKRS